MDALLVSIHGVQQNRFLASTYALRFVKGLMRFSGRVRVMHEEQPAFYIGLKQLGRDGHHFEWIDASPVDFTVNSKVYDVVAVVSFSIGSPESQMADGEMKCA